MVRDRFSVRYWSVGIVGHRNSRHESMMLVMVT